jgi:ribosome-binding protein aMBF1 (putative translation factor)
MILETIASAIVKSGKSRYQISRDLNIDQTVLFRLVHGQGGCTIETLDKLCVYLGLELRARRRKAR